MRFSKGDRVKVVVSRGNCFGQEFVVLWFANSMYGLRPVYEAGWDGRPVFFTEQELVRV